MRLKYAATLNDAALPEETDPEFEFQYVDIGNVDSSGHIEEPSIFTFANAPSRARRIVKHGDVIVSTVRTYLQAIAAIEDPPDNLIVSTGFAVVRPRADKLDANFCKFALREPDFLHEVVSRSVGVSYPAINSSELGDIKIPLPSLVEQRAIADFLDVETTRLDALVKAKEDLLAHIAEKRVALIAAAVTGQIFSNDWKKQTAKLPIIGKFEAVKFRDSKVPWLGKIPAHWKTSRIATLFRERDERGEPDLPLLEVSINAGVVVREFSDEYIEATAEDFNSYKVARAGDLAFNRMRMWQGAVGVVPVDGLVSPDYAVAAPTGDLRSDYAGLLFRDPMFSAECARQSHGIVWDRMRIYWAEFRDIRVPVPPPDEQREIVDFVAAETTKLGALRDATVRTISLLKERRSALIAAAVKGRLGAVAAI